jgi:hypothetical protein
MVIPMNDVRRLLGLEITHAHFNVPLHVAAPALLPDLFMRVPQCGHTHSPNNMCDLKNETRRRDIGVRQREQ